MHQKGKKMQPLYPFFLVTRSPWKSIVSYFVLKASLPGHSHNVIINMNIFDMQSHVYGDDTRTSLLEYKDEAGL